mgnify:CR=1 FL=1
MNKYELVVVVSAKLEEEERAAEIEKVSNLVTRFGGTITDVEEWEIGRASCRERV